MGNFFNDSEANARGIGAIEDTGAKDSESRSIGAVNVSAGGRLGKYSAEMTRPNDATAYAANDVVGANTAAISTVQLVNVARVAGGSGYIVSAAVSTDKVSITPRLRLHFFSDNAPTVAFDNAAYKEIYADRTKRVCTIDLPAIATAADAGNSNCSRTFDLGLRVPFICAEGSRDLFVVIETLDVFTPNANQKFAVSIIADLN